MLIQNWFPPQNFFQTLTKSQWEVNKISLPKTTDDETPKRSKHDTWEFFTLEFDKEAKLSWVDKAHETKDSIQ